VKAGRAASLFLAAFACGAFQNSPISLATEQAAAGRYAAAAEILTKSLESNPKSGEPSYLLLSNCHLQMEQPGKAVDTLRMGLRIYPAAPTLERMLGEILFRQKYDSTEAGTLLAHAAKAMARDPEAKHYYAQWAYLNARDRICTLQEREALALPGLNDLALLQMYTLWGLCESRLEEADNARAAFEHANDINERQQSYDPVAAFQYIQFLTRYNDEARALQIVDEVIRRIPEFGPAHLEKAKYFDRSRQPARAIEEARAALASRGNDLNSERAAHALLAKCDSLLGRTDDAAREQQWIESHPNPETRAN
jgi:tetratricopeptide (TPR) repeat protein